MNDQLITRAVQLLRKLEFSGTEVDYGDPWEPLELPNEYPCCPCCGGESEHDETANYISYLRRQRISNDSCSRFRRNTYEN